MITNFFLAYCLPNASSVDDCKDIDWVPSPMIYDVVPEYFVECILNDSEGISCLIRLFNYQINLNLSFL